MVIYTSSRTSMPETYRNLALLLASLLWVHNRAVPVKISINFQPSFEIKTLRIIRKDPSDSRDKAPTSALHWLFQELFAGLKVKFVTSHTHTNTHTHFLHSSQQQGRCRDCNFLPWVSLSLPWLSLSPHVSPSPTCVTPSDCWIPVLKCLVFY